MFNQWASLRHGPRSCSTALPTPPLSMVTRFPRHPRRRRHQHPLRTSDSGACPWPASPRSCSCSRVPSPRASAVREEAEERAQAERRSRRPCRLSSARRARRSTARRPAARIGRAAPPTPPAAQVSPRRAPRPGAPRAANAGQSRDVDRTGHTRRQVGRPLKPGEGARARYHLQARRPRALRRRLHRRRGGRFPEAHGGALEIVELEDALPARQPGLQVLREPARRARARPMEFDYSTP